MSSFGRCQGRGSIVPQRSRATRRPGTPTPWGNININNSCNLVVTERTGPILPLVTQSKSVPLLQQHQLDQPLIRKQRADGQPAIHSKNNDERALRRPPRQQSETRSAFGKCVTGGSRRSGRVGSKLHSYDSASYELNLGGVTLPPREIFSRSIITSGDGSGDRSRPKKVMSTTINQRSSSSHDLSLLEQKKIQWAKEREELSGLWSPWGLRSDVKGHYTNSLSAHGGGHGEVYLPPINSPHLEVVGHQRGRSLSTAIDCPATHLLAQQRKSLPNNQQQSLAESHEQRQNQHHNQNHNQYSQSKNSRNQNQNNFSTTTTEEQKSTYHRQGNAEWITIHNNNNNSNSSGNNGNFRHEAGESMGPGGDAKESSPRVIVHKIYLDHTEDTTRRADVQTRMSQSSDGGPITRGFHGGSSGYLNKPPPVAMRSSLSIGLQSPNDASALQEVQRKERDEWLHELEKQREEQRLRKLQEKDEKRLRWGDRGIGVGHFWEPQGAGDRLPSRHGNTSDSSDTSAPSWLQRSLTRTDGSQSQPDLYTNIPPSSAAMSFISGSGSAVDLRQLVDVVPSFESAGSEQRSYLRGQNVPVDPDEKVEKERKMRANQEHLDAIKKQIEDKQRLQKEEKEREKREEQEHEIRMAKQRELERQRVEMEKRQRNRTATNNVTSDIVKPSDAREREYSDKAPLHESPLIPHQVVDEPDAWEMEIARRQALLLAQNQAESQSSADLHEEHRQMYAYGDGGGPNNYNHNQHSIPPRSAQVDQCLMTDSDHLYERTLTPTRERLKTGNTIFDVPPKEFGTQTEISEDQGMTTDDSHSRHKTSHFSQMKKPIKEEKPRWGANPVRKVYLKQSEKDPNYQQRLRRKAHLQQQQASYGDTDESDHQDLLPFHRIRGRKSPLKALHSQSQYNVPNNARKTPPRSSTKNLNKKYRSQPQLVSSQEDIVSSNLGKIHRKSVQGGLDSVGVSEESSGFTSPSHALSNSRGGSGSSGLPSSTSMPFIPLYSREFVSMQDFDEMPITAGKIAPSSFLPQAPISVAKSPSRLVSAQDTKRTSGNPPRSQPVVRNNTAPKPPLSTKKKVKIPPSNPHPLSPPQRRNSTPTLLPQQRSTSPPVPALAKKLSLGLIPDDTGRLSSLSAELLSPLPVTPIGIPTPSPTPMNLTPRESNAKVDIDIAITHAGNPDLQRLLQEFELMKKDDLKLPQLVSSRSDASRPLTHNTEASLLVQEEFIRDLISRQEVQEQLSAREKELTEKGIIEFNVRVPSGWNPISNGGKHLRAGKHGIEYRDPLISARRNATAAWLTTVTPHEPPQPILTNLSALKQGLKHQQQELMSLSSTTHVYN